MLGLVLASFRVNSFVSDIAVFMLIRDVKLQPTNLGLIVNNREGP